MRGLIGLTGNIATGKSEVARELRRLGATVVDADQVARDIVAKGQPALAQIEDAFGPGILSPTGELDRARLGNLVFGDAAQLRALEAITSPIARAELWRRIAEAYSLALGRVEKSAIVAEVIRLFEGGYAGHCQQIWVTHCPEHIQIARLMEHRKFSEPEARARVQAQPPQADKVARAHVLIDTSGSISHTHEQARVAYDAFLAGL